MEAICFLCFPLLPPRPSSSSSCSPDQQMGSGRRRRKLSIVAVKRDACNWDFEGWLVDESMIILRRRIHEMKMVERNYEPPNKDWMEWKKRYYTSYDASICKAVGVLQALLMNTRPSLALGMVALVGFSVPTSMVFTLLHSMNATNGIFSGIHLIN